MPPASRESPFAARSRLPARLTLAWLALLAPAACSPGARTEPGSPSAPIALPPPSAPTAAGRASPPRARPPARTAGVSRAVEPLVREEQSLEVDGVRETWSLVWDEPPSLFCTEGWSCPCSGLEFGEHGRVTLVRRRPGEPDEAFALGEQVLPRWERPAGGGIEPPSEAELASAPPVRILDFRDYDHDGWATEFTLRVDTMPCGKRVGVVLGVGRANRALHVFGTAEHPDEPLLLTLGQWARVAAVPRAVLTTWPCGDHGAITESEVVVRADAAGLHAREREYRCVERGDRAGRGALRSDEPYRSGRWGELERMTLGPLGE